MSLACTMCRHMRISAFLYLLAHLGLIAASSTNALAAQTIQVSVIDSVSGMPVVEGFVVLIDMRDRVVQRVLNRGGEPPTMRAPEPGYYRVRSERIGYHVVVSDPVMLREGETVEFELKTMALPVRLEAIQVEETRRCRANPEQGRETAAVWEEARKALEAAVWTAASGGYWYRSRLYQRELNLERRVVLSEESREQTGSYRAPFASVNAETLADSGYVVRREDGWQLYAPDALVLLDETFLNDHCFLVVRDVHDGEQRIGLHFEPVLGRDVADITGSLWLSEQSAELRRLDFSYTGLPHDIEDNRLGGTLHFMPTPAGAWIIRDWQLRMPLFERRSVGFDRRGMLEQAMALGAFRDAGGEVLEMRRGDGTRVYAADLATITGAVVDTVSGRPLADARVFVEGGGDTTTTDAAGRFHFAGAYDGEHRVVYTHPLLEAAGYAPPSTSVTLARGQADTLTLEVPSRDELVTALCGDAAFSGMQLVGQVVDVETGQPQGGVNILLSSPDLPAILRRHWNLEGARDTLATDADGFYRVCGIPAGSEFTMFAIDGERLSDFVNIRIDEPDTTSGTVDALWGIGRQDLHLQPPSRRTGVVRGKVTDMGGQLPVSGADVFLAGTQIAAQTDSAGAFELTHLPAGILRLIVRRVMYEPRQVVLTAAANDTVIIPDSVLTLGPIQLDPVVVEAEASRQRRNLAEFELRRESTTGAFLTREEFLEQGNPNQTTDIVRRLPGFVVRTNPAYNLDPNDFRRWIVESSRGRSRGPAFLGQTECPLLVFLDGLYLGDTSANGVNLDVVIPFDDIEAVEGYSGTAAIPPEFNRLGATCGVLVFWTR